MKPETKRGLARLQSWVLERLPGAEDELLRRALYSALEELEWARVEADGAAGWTERTVLRQLRTRMDAILSQVLEARP